jgi:hypothetical protein
MGRVFTITIILLMGAFHSTGQKLDSKHDPKKDFNLSPAHNTIIDPGKNSTINPKLNWNINPLKNGLINPEFVEAINPKIKTDINPVYNLDLNPMYVPNLSPRFPIWSGLYVFDKEDNHIGYITPYSQTLLIEFDKEINFKCFYIRTAKGTFNQFNLSSEWTGFYLCFDSMIGYNIFDKQGEWTGMHIK